MKDLYSKNCKTPGKRLKMTQINGKIHCDHGLKELIMLKMSILHK